MNIDTLVIILRQMGYTVRGYDSNALYLVDPSCIFVGFKTFFEYAWVIIVILTGIMLTGWAISLLRGAKNDIFTNMKNLVLILGIASVTMPIVSFVWGDNIEQAACDVVTVPMSDVNQILSSAKNNPMSQYNEFDEFEKLDIYDTGVTSY